jgi:hypothetical protein
MAGVLRDGESFLENHESAEGRDAPQVRLRGFSKEGREGGQVSFSGGFFTKSRPSANGASHGSQRAFSTPVVAGKPHLRFMADEIRHSVRATAMERAVGPQY